MGSGFFESLVDLKDVHELLQRLLVLGLELLVLGSDLTYLDF